MPVRTHAAGATQSGTNHGKKASCFVFPELIASRALTMLPKNMSSPFSAEELLRAKRWQFECLSTGFDHVMRQPCHTEHVNQYIGFLRRDRHFGDLIHHTAPAVV